MIKIRFSSLVDGEERLVEVYDEAIADAAGDSEASTILKRQRAELTDRISSMQRIAV